MPESGRPGYRAVDDIDRLLRAIAENDPKYRNDAARHSGSVAAALDSITRWIDRAEKRFDELTIRHTLSERLLAHVATLAATAPRNDDILEAKRLAMEAVDAVGQGQLLEKRRQTIRRRRIVALTAILERMTDTLQGLDREIVRIEECIAQHDVPLSQKIQELAATLDSHVRHAAQEAETSKQYFELMTGRIEAFAEELRQVREMHKGADSLPAPPPRSDRRQADVDSGRPDDFPASPPPKQRLSTGPETPAAIFSTEDESARIRSGLIAAARQAKRMENAADRDALAQPGRYFLR